MEGRSPIVRRTLFGLACMDKSDARVWLRRFSKFVCFMVACLIFKGALVTSHDAGLSVPDWPSSYGYSLFTFPISRWQGIIFFEHVHRLLASFVGVLTVILAAWVTLVEERGWVKWLAWGAVALVIVQGLLGGLTVLLYLPTAISTAHAVVGQTFFLLIFILAYTLSTEYSSRVRAQRRDGHPETLRRGLVLLALIYVQLIVGAVMRHTGAGLAIPDFPQFGGRWLPTLDQSMVDAVNHLRRALHLFPDVGLGQVLIHFAHRLGGFVVLLAVVVLLLPMRKFLGEEPRLRRNISALMLCGPVQIMLGVLAVVSGRDPLLTSLHVIVGALMLALTVLLVLRSYPVGMPISMRRLFREVENEFLLLLGIFSAGMGIHSFLIPRGLIDGGVTGVSMLLAKSSGISLSFLLPLVNLPFVIVGYFLMGGAFALRSVVGIFGLALVLLVVPFPHVTSDPVLTALFGGVFLGAGIGFAVRGGAVLDGTEIAALLISRRVRIVKVGDVILSFNVVLFLCALSILGVDLALYSILTYFAAAKTLDFVLYGIDEFTSITIISDLSTSIKERITLDLGRGITVYRGYGGMSGAERDILQCVVTRLELGKVRSIVHELDSNAFIFFHALAGAEGGRVKARGFH